MYARTVEDYIHELSRIPPETSRRKAVEDAAEQLGVSAATVYRWIAANDCGEHAIRITNLLDARRRGGKLPACTITDVAALQAGHAGAR